MAHVVEAVLTEGRRWPGFTDHARWSALRSVQNVYRFILHNVGLADPNATRLEAIDRGGVKCDFDIVLLGTLQKIRVYRAI
jgi:hypothetical protein